MFNRKKRVMEAINMIKPTSKYELKQSCLMLCNLNIEKAEKMYDFMIKGMENMPEVPPAQKPFIENVKEQSSEIFGWLRENEDVLTKGAQFIKGLFSRKASAPTEPLPPING